MPRENLRARSRALVLVVAALVGALLTSIAPLADACCPAPPSGKPVVNADQTVILVWDAAKKTQHFIRRAAFKSDADDFGFLVPTPEKPELAESGDAAFPFLQKLTEPEVIKQPRPSAGCGCAGELSRSKSADVSRAPPPVRVLDEKTVAGFHAVVLEASSADALVGWLKEHGYAFSPEIEAWAKPYVDGGWKITALKVAKGGKQDQRVAAAALRLSFKTDRPLFPYREPDSTNSVKALGATERLLRIYFIGDARYAGELTKEQPWTGTVAWAGKLAADDGGKIFEQLGLARGGAPAELWLTEFEDPWPYRAAPADLYFARNPQQRSVKRPPIVEYTSARGAHEAALAALGVVAVWRLQRRRTPSRR